MVFKAGFGNKTKPQTYVVRYLLLLFTAICLTFQKQQKIKSILQKILNILPLAPYYHI